MKSLGFIARVSKILIPNSLAFKGTVDPGKIFSLELRLRYSE
jgi:hypothetical protein